MHSPRLGHPTYHSCTFLYLELNLSITNNSGQPIKCDQIHLCSPLARLDIAFRAELECPDLSAKLAETGSVDAVLNLIGNSVFLDSMKIPKRGGRQCLAGFLGGLAPLLEPFDPLAVQLPSGVQFSFFGSFHFGQPHYVDDGHESI